MGLLPKPGKAKRVTEVRKYIDAMNTPDYDPYDHESLPDIVPRPVQQTTRLENELKRQKAQGLYE